MDAVNAASVAVIFAICLQMGKEAILDWRTVIIAGISVLITFGYPKINSAFIVLFGALAGYILYLV